MHRNNFTFTGTNEKGMFYLAGLSTATLHSVCCNSLQCEYWGTGLMIMTRISRVFIIIIQLARLQASWPVPVSLNSLYVLWGVPHGWYFMIMVLAGQIPDVVTGIFHWHNPSAALWPWGSTRPLTEINNRLKAAGALVWQSYYLHVPTVLDSRKPRPPGTLRACPGIYRDYFTLFCLSQSIRRTCCTNLFL